MNKVMLLAALMSVFVSSSCTTGHESPVQSPVECSIFPIDSYSGEIGFYTMDENRIAFTAFFIPAASAKEAKRSFDSNVSVQEKENFISRQLSDYDQKIEIECVAASAQDGFKIVCDKALLGVEAGADLSHLFKVYPIAEFKYPDYSIIAKCYGQAHAPTLYDYLSAGSVWMQPGKNGLLFEPVSVPDMNSLAEEEAVTITLSVPVAGQSSAGETVQKTFEGSFSFFPNLPGEPDII